MDISKIRKKAKEKERKGEERPASSPPPAPEEKVPEPVVKEPEPPKSREEKLPGKAPAPAVQETIDEASVEAQEEHIIELLTFSLAKEEFAFRVSEVEEIIRYQRVTKVPTMPEYVSGITSLRGKIIPVVDLKIRLILRGASAAAQQQSGMDAGGAEDKNEKILILAGPQGLIGATIDRVMSVVRFPEKELLGPPAHLSEEERRYIEGVVILDKRFISVVRAADALNIEVGTG